MSERFEHSSYFKLHAHVERRKSAIHGSGIFASRPLKRGECVIVAGGKVMSDSEWRAARAGRDDLQGMPIIADEIYLVSEGVGAGVNHSCSPNLIVEGQILWRAWRDIDAGEELTTDYATFLDIDDENYVGRCRCGSVGCRAIVTLKDWLLPSVRARYGEHFNPAILEKARALSASDIRFAVRGFQHIDKSRFMETLAREWNTLVNPEI